MHTERTNHRTLHEFYHLSFQGANNNQSLLMQLFISSHVVLVCTYVTKARHNKMGKYPFMYASTQDVKEFTTLNECSSRWLLEGGTEGGNFCVQTFLSGTENFFWLQAVRDGGHPFRPKTWTGIAISSNCDLRCLGILPSMDQRVYALRVHKARSTNSCIIIEVSICH